jgi:hypothetical protein
MAQPVKQYQAYAYKVAQRYNIPWYLFFGLIRQESNWDQGAGSSAGAIGLTQKMGYSYAEKQRLKTDWRYNIVAGAKEFSSDLRRFGNVKQALAAYNAGPNRAGVSPYNPSQLPRETQLYVPAVLGYANQYKGKGGAPVGGATPTSGGFYVNPYKNYLGPDQGTDWGMKGPVGAVGRAKIIRSGTITFKQGTGYIVAYQLLDGPMKGKRIYVMENITPTVKVGQIVGKGQTIAIAHGVYPYLETGWADARGSLLAPYGSVSLGKDFYAFLQKAHTYTGGGTAPPPGRNGNRPGRQQAIPMWQTSPLGDLPGRAPFDEQPVSLLDSWQQVANVSNPSPETQALFANAQTLGG